jgi:hypothetical protein
MHDTGTKMPTSLPSGRSQCFCGAAIDIASTGRPTFLHSQQFPDRFGLSAILGPRRLWFDCRAAVLNHHASLAAATCAGWSTEV